MSATSTATNDAELAMKHQPMPTPEMSQAARAGPRAAEWSCSDGQAADYGAEMGPALRQVAFLGTDVGMEPDCGKVDVISRSSPIDTDSHHAVADQPLGNCSQQFV